MVVFWDKVQLQLDTFIYIKRAQVRVSARTCERPLMVTECGITPVSKWKQTRYEADLHFRADSFFYSSVFSTEAWSYSPRQR